jgi:archaemetzincin
LQSRNQDRIIAIQPLENYDTSYLTYISNEISNFYSRKVIVLKPIPIPASFKFAQHSESYSADSILNWLQKMVNGEIIEILGLTHKEIGILKKINNTSGNPLFDHYMEPIFGLADFPGKCCIISDYKFASFDWPIFKTGLRKVVIHEMGHNLKLDHCNNDTCIMSEKNGTFSGLYKSGDDYCDVCKITLKRQNQ